MHRATLAIPLLTLLVLSVCAPGRSQARNPFGDLTDQAKTPRTVAVSYLFPEQVTVPANKQTAVNLHFNIAAGLHINSHTPHTDDLIPTTLKLPQDSGVKLAKATFPTGTEFTFPVNPKEKLSVYTGDFTVHAELVATPGEHLVEGSLRYQACDNNACMPPHSIPVVIDVIAK